jgi:small subunit ribosomal protein S2
MSKVDVKALLEAGVHFGHRTEKWNPKMKPYIFEARNGIYIINLLKTAEMLESACEFLKSIVTKGEKALFVGCKKQSQAIVKELAGRCGAFYVNERWLGGTLTNLKTIRKSVARMREIDNIEKDGASKLPKQELAALRREGAKIHRYLDGISDMEKPPGVLIIVDITREYIAVQEAKRLNIPIIAICDTNSNPELVEYPVAGNDDAIRSIRIVLEKLAEAIEDATPEKGGKKLEKSIELTAVSA